MKKYFFNPKIPKKLSKWVPGITEKSIKSEPGPHRVLPCALQCPRIAPGSFQAPQDAEVEAPSMPNNTHGQQNPPKIHRNPVLDLPQDAKVVAPSMPNNTHGQQNLPQIGRTPGLDLKVSFVVFPSVTKKPKMQR